mgnify:CR=1 FL=1
MIDLTKFCANKTEVREYLQAPFQLGECVYATNGHLAVRIPRDEAPHITEHPSAPKSAQKLFDDTFALEGEFAALPAPDSLPANRTCTDCGGTGIEPASEDEDYCFTCYGLGVMPDPMDVGDANFKLPYVRLMASLPNARIRTHGPSKPAAILFDGGQGLLMPYRK